MYSVWPACNCTWLIVYLLCLHFAFVESARKGASVSNVLNVKHELNETIEAETEAAHAHAALLLRLQVLVEHSEAGQALLAQRFGEYVDAMLAQRAAHNLAHEWRQQVEVVDKRRIALVRAHVERLHLLRIVRDKYGRVGEMLDQKLLLLFVDVVAERELARQPLRRVQRLDRLCIRDAHKRSVARESLCNERHVVDDKRRRRHWLLLVRFRFVFVRFRFACGAVCAVCRVNKVNVSFGVRVVEAPSTHLLDHLFDQIKQLVQLVHVDRLGLEHVELGHVMPSQRLLGTKRRTQRVDSRQRCGHCL